MTPFTQTLIALGALVLLAAAGVWRGHVSITIRRRPEPRQRPLSPAGRILPPEEGTP